MTVRSRLDRYRDRYERALGRAGRGDPVGRAGDFDFRGAYDEAMGAYRADFMEDFGRSAEDVRSSFASSGRLLTGFGEKDYRDWEDTQGENFARTAGQMSGQLAQAQYGVESGAADRYLALLSGGMDREIARENAQRRRKGGLFGSLGSLAGGLAGQFLIPGMGAAAGAQIGGAAGSALGGY